MFNTSTTSKKRKMIFLPEVNPNDFLFFFEKGSSGFSYSLRDYSVPNRVSERYAREFPWSADELIARARNVFDAPTIDTTNLAFWHAYTLEGRRLLQPAGDLAPAQKRTARCTDALLKPARATEERFPILDYQALQALPKFRKTGDLKRMLTSPNSEDWVTWNLLRLIGREGASGWSRIQRAVASCSPELDLAFLQSGVPRMSFWRDVKSPKTYESASRRRMLESGEATLVARASDPQPVEGASEIDLEFSSEELLVFIEAKLGSDISARTTYDSTRNQIVRNIDCLIEEAHGRTPAFWMFVRDLGPGRAYVQLMREYQDKPGSLANSLPHRDPALLAAIAQRLVLVRWRDVGESVCTSLPDDDEYVRAVKTELRRRIS